MDLAKEIITDVVQDRILIGVDENDFNNCKLKEGLNEVEFLLRNSLEVAVHIVLGHEKCMAQDISRCKTAKTLEVWTLRIVYDGSFEMRVIFQIIFIKNF